MTCPRCRRAMTERRRTFHKHRKWVCARCGAVRRQPVKRRDRKAERT